MHIKAQPLGEIKSILTISPNSPKVSESSSWCTNFDRCPTQRVVLQTKIKYIKFMRQKEKKKKQQKRFQ